MANRDFIVRIDAGVPSQGGAGCLLAYRVGSQIEIVATEEKGGDAAVLLSEDQARAFADALTESIARSPR